MKPLPAEQPTHTSGWGILLWLARHQKAALFTTFIVRVVWLSTIALLPVVFGVAIDTVIVDGEGLLWWVLGLIGLTLLVAILTVAREVAGNHCGMIASIRATRLVNAHVAHVGGAINRDGRDGEIVSAANSDAEQLQFSFGGDVQSFGSALITPVVAVLLLSYDVLVGTVVIIAVVVHIIVLSRLSKPLENRISGYRKRLGYVADDTVDIVTGIRPLRAIGGEDRIRERFGRRSRDLRNEGYRIAVPDALLEMLTVAMPAFLGIGVLALAISKAVTGDISEGDVVAIFGLSSFLIMPMENIAALFRNIPQALASAKHLGAFLETTPEYTLSGVNSPFRPGQWSDADTGLSLTPGALTVIVASNPRRMDEAANRLTGQSDGDARIDDVPITDIAARELRENVVQLRSDHILFTDTLRANLDPHGRHDDEVLNSALAAATAHDAVDSLGGLDGILRKNGSNVSGGQRARLRLARSLVHNPEFLLAVEPTSALDAYTEQAVVEAVTRYRERATTVVVSTSPMWLDAADRVVFLSDSGAAVAGSVDELASAYPEFADAIARVGV